MNAIVTTELLKLRGIKVVLQAIQAESGIVILARDYRFGGGIFFGFAVVLRENDAGL